MKKLFVMMAAVAALALVSCEGQKSGEAGGSVASKSSAVSGEQAKGNVIDMEKFSIALPEGFKETAKLGGTINAASEDNSITIDATFNENGPTLAELAKYAENYAGMMKAQKFIPENPKLDGKTLILKSVNDKGEVNQHFVVMKEDKIAVAGSLKYPKDKEADAEKLLDPLMKSVKFK